MSDNISFFLAVLSLLFGLAAYIAASMRTHETNISVVTGEPIESLQVELARISQAEREHYQRLTREMHSIAEEIRSSETQIMQPRGAPAAGAGAGAGAGASLLSGRIVRELAHSLGTPLAGVKATVVTLQQLTRDEVSNPRSDHLNRISTAVDLCQAILFSYRKIADVEDNSGLLATSSLKKSLTDATALFASASGRPVQANIDVPDNIGQLPNMQILSVMVPLLENAVEYTTDDRVAVIYELIGERETLIVRNAAKTPLPTGYLHAGI